MTPDSRITLNSGGRMPVMGLGSWKLTDKTADTVIKAIGAGYRMIDTARDYGSQAGIGEAVRKSDLDRDDLFVVTKIEEDDDAYRALKQDLKELDLDYADLTLIHRPPDTGVGEDLWRGLIRARDEGLARNIGVSNYSADQLDRLVDATGVVPAVNQVEWSPFGHSDALQNHLARQDVVLMAYSPLTRGERLDAPELQEIAEAHGKSPAQVMIRWNLQRGTVPVPKANKTEHCRENLDVFDFELSQDQMTQLDELNERWSALSDNLSYD